MPGRRMCVCVVIVADDQLSCLCADKIADTIIMLKVTDVVHSAAVAVAEICIVDWDLAGIGSILTASTSLCAC